jgi:hypothetical protein
MKFTLGVLGLDVGFQLDGRCTAVAVCVAVVRCQLRQHNAPATLPVPLCLGCVLRLVRVDPSAMPSFC